MSKKHKSTPRSGDTSDSFMPPMIKAASVGCPDWQDRVRLFSYGLLKGDKKAATAGHLQKCAACRIFLLSCLEAQKALESAVETRQTTAPATLTYVKPSSGPQQEDNALASWLADSLETFSEEALPQQSSSHAKAWASRKRSPR